MPVADEDAIIPVMVIMVPSTFAANVEILVARAPMEAFGVGGGGSGVSGGSGVPGGSWAPAAVEPEREPAATAGGGPAATVRVRRERKKRRM
ncbi:MAG: hypothetical protein Q9166_002208 [cf. Caloplaca sp. 2 TL-2023]